MSQYAINGTLIPTQPTTGRWLPRNNRGYDGNGRPVYSGVREFELKWQLIDPETAYVLQQYFDAVSTTGTVIIDLPYFLSGSNVFVSYTGCVLQEPQLGTYFTGYLQNLILIVSKIVT
jgi:hypothetical protein